MSIAFFKTGASGPHFLDVDVSSEAVRIATTDGERACAALNARHDGKSKYTTKRRAQCLWLVAHAGDGILVSDMYACLQTDMLNVLSLCVEMGLLKQVGALPWRPSQGAGIWGNGHHLDYKKKIRLKALHGAPYENVRLAGRFECDEAAFRAGFSIDDVARSVRGGGVVSETSHFYS